MQDNNSKKIEFINEKNTEKFKKGSGIKFSDGTFMCNWFYYAKDIILTSNDNYDIEIQKQYKEFKNSKKIEFLNEQDMDKFRANKTNVIFSDGTYMGSWFYRQKKQIFSSDEKLDVEIKKQYSEYKNINIYAKTEEFLKEPNLDKFNRLKEVKFKDGKEMGIWFYFNKKAIMDKNYKYYNELKKQYEEYITSKRLSLRKNIDYNKCLEFALIDGFDKFDYNKKITFSDGTIMHIWFKANKKKISLSDDEICKKIMIQYEEFKERKFNKKVEEFLEINDSIKFNTAQVIYSFSDGTLVSRWFIKHKERLFAIKSPEIEKLKEEYEIYCSGHHARKQRKSTKYYEKLKEFALDTNFEKFNNNINDHYFLDGVKKSAWFYQNRNYILTSDDEYSRLIILQYEEYKNQIIKKKEFLEEKDYRKFLTSKTDIRFTDGSSMNLWFNTNRPSIFNSTDEYFILIKKQFEEYCISKYVDADKLCSEKKLK